MLNLKQTLWTLLVLFTGLICVTRHTFVTPSTTLWTVPQNFPHLSAAPLGG